MSSHAKLTDSDRFTRAVFDIESAKLTDSESATLFTWVSEIESVKLTDSVRFTPAVFDVSVCQRY